MAKDSGHPDFPKAGVKNVVPFNKAVDDSVKASFEPVFDADGKQVVMPGAFKARRDAQINSRKKQGY